MDQITRGHRRFALLVLVAIAGLLPSISHAAAPAAEKLQILVNATAAQLQLAYRQHPDERARRQEQLTAAVAAWRAAPRNEVNNERLATWLRAAILNSMPGSMEPLPAVPSFAAVVKAEPQPEIHEAPVDAQTIEKQPTTVEKKPEAAEKQPEMAESAIEKQAPVEAVAKPDDNPFRDDPVSDSEQK